MRYSFSKQGNETFKWVFQDFALSRFLVIVIVCELY